MKHGQLPGLQPHRQERRQSGVGPCPEHVSRYPLARGVSTTYCCHRAVHRRCPVRLGHCPDQVPALSHNRQAAPIPGIPLHDAFSTSTTHHVQSQPSAGRTLSAAIFCAVGRPTAWPYGGRLRTTDEARNQRCTGYARDPHHYGPQPRSARLSERRVPLLRQWQ